MNTLRWGFIFLSIALGIMFFVTSTVVIFHHQAEPRDFLMYGLLLLSTVFCFSIAYSTWRMR